MMNYEQRYIEVIKRADEIERQNARRRSTAMKIAAVPAAAAVAAGVFGVAKLTSSKSGVVLDMSGAASASESVSDAVSEILAPKYKAGDLQTDVERLFTESVWVPCGEYKNADGTFSLKPNDKFDFSGHLMELDESAEITDNITINIRGLFVCKNVDYIIYDLIFKDGNIPYYRDVDGFRKGDTVQMVFNKAVGDNWKIYNNDIDIIDESLPYTLYHDGAVTAVSKIIPRNGSTLDNFDVAISGAYFHEEKEYVFIDEPVVFNVNVPEDVLSAAKEKTFEFDESFTVDMLEEGSGKLKDLAISETSISFTISDSEVTRASAFADGFRELYAKYPARIYFKDGSQFTLDSIYLDEGDDAKDYVGRFEMYYPLDLDKIASVQIGSAMIDFETGSVESVDISDFVPVNEDEWMRKYDPYYYNLKHSGELLSEREDQNN